MGTNGGHKALPDDTLLFSKMAGKWPVENSDSIKCPSKTFKVECC